MRTAGTSRQSALALTGIYQKERFCLKDFFKTSSFKVLAIAVVVLLGLIIYTATAGGSLLASLLGFVTSPIVLVVLAGVAGLCVRAAKGGLKA